jgi:hypothetical protein
MQLGMVSNTHWLTSDFLHRAIAGMLCMAYLQEFWLHDSSVLDMKVHALFQCRF